VRRTAHDDVTGTLPKVFPPPPEVGRGTTLLQPESHPVAQAVTAHEPASQPLSPSNRPGSPSKLHAATASLSVGRYPGAFQ
jgi:hypothetical protein